MITALLLGTTSTLAVALFHMGAPNSLFDWVDGETLLLKIIDVSLYSIWMFICLMPIIGQTGNAIAEGETTYLMLMLLMFLPVHLVTLLQFKYRVSFYKP